MKRILETIVTELNPAHDFDKVGFDSGRNATSSDELVRAQMKNFLFFLGLPKSIVRGGIIIGTAVALGGLVFGYSPIAGFAYGAATGAGLDATLYLTKGVYHYAREQFFPSH